MRIRPVLLAGWGIAGLLGYCAAPAAAAPTRTEAAVIHAVETQGDAPEVLLEKLVNVNSGTFNRPGVEEVGKLLEAEFRSLGFQIRRVPMDAVSRASHLVAERAGKHGKRVLLIGHMDTVFEPASGFLQFQRHGDTATGPGSVDDKGGVVVMLTALRALKLAGQLEGSAITAYLTADEEHPGDPVATTRADFIEAGKRADATLCFEAGVTIAGQDYASTARRGATSWTLTATGRAAHSGGIFSDSVGDGAIFELSRILSRFHDELREPNLTYSAGLALGGANLRIDPGGAGSASGKGNIVPSEARAIGDIRALTPEQLARVKERMVAIVAANLPGTTAQLTFYDEYPPMAPTPANAALMQRYSDASEAIGHGPIKTLDPLLRGAGDSAFVSPYVATITGLGAKGEGSHTSGETVNLKSLPIQAERAAVLIYRLTHERAH
jgi:glutamate carboxypeptidase